MSDQESNAEFVARARDGISRGAAHHTSNKHLAEALDRLERAEASIKKARAEEREACAQRIENYTNVEPGSICDGVDLGSIMQDLAAAIRKRKP